MKKNVAILILSAAVIVAMTGCAATDFNMVNQVTYDGYKQTHSIHQAIGSTVAAGHLNSAYTGVNTQQTIERAADDQFVRAQPGALPCTYNTTFTTANGSMPGGIVGGLTTQEARDMERFIHRLGFAGGTHLLVGGQPQNSGSWYEMGIKVLDTDCDGVGFPDLRINTWAGQGLTALPFPPFSCNFVTTPACAGDRTSLEMKLMGEAIEGYEIPTLTVETIAIDALPGCQFGPNILAHNQFRNAPANGYFVFRCWTGTAQSGGPLHAAVKPAAGLAGFFSGERTTIAMPGVEGDMTATGVMREDGLIDWTMYSWRLGDSTFTPSEPIHFAVDREFRLWEFNIDADALPEWLEMARWFLNSGADQVGAFGDQGMHLHGFMPEMGVEFPDQQIQFSRTFLENWINLTERQIAPKERGR